MIYRLVTFVAALLFTTLVVEACTSAPPPAAPTEAGKKKRIDNNSSNDDESDELNTEEETTTDEDGADSQAADEADPIGGFEALLHAAKLQECHDDGRIYDRRTATGDSDPGSCHVDAKYPADFECSVDGVIAAFNSSTNIKNYVATQEAEGFEIDQCGTYDNGNPIVFYLKQEGTDAEPELRVRVVEPN